MILAITDYFWLELLFWVILLLSIITDFDIKIIFYLYKNFLRIHIFICTEIFE